MSLESIVDNVGAAILEVVRAPAGLDVAVAEIVIYDPTDPRGIEAGDVILAVGVNPVDRDGVALLRRASEGGAAAVVLKLEPGGVAPAAIADGGVAVLGVAPDIVWGQLHGLLRTACAAAGVSGDVTAGGAPVGDLFALANAVSSMVGGATTIEDPRSTVLAYSSTDAPIDEPRRRTILGRRVPDEWLRRLEGDGVFRRIWAGGVVRVDYSDTDPEYRTRLAVAVRAGGEVLGTIWVVEGDRPLDAGAELALEEAGRIAALHLLRHRAGDDLERSRRADLLRSVLGGRTSPDVLAKSIGVSDASVVTVVGFALSIDPDAAIADQIVMLDRAVSSITVHCEAYRRQAVSVAEGRVVYVVLPDRTPPEPTRLTSFASSVVDHLIEGIRVDAKAGIGPSVDGFSAMLRSRAEADQTLRVLAGEPRRVAHIDDVRSRAILLTLHDLASRNPGLRIGKIDRLIEHDRKREGAYVQTLHAYLDAFGDVVTAAAHMQVHPNTFRYRLRRLLELSEIDLQMPAERLITHLQLMFLEHDGDGDR